MKVNMKIVIPNCGKCPAVRKDIRLPNISYCAVSGSYVENVESIAFMCPFRKLEVDLYSRIVKEAEELLELFPVYYSGEPQEVILGIEESLKNFLEFIVKNVGKV